MKDEIIDLDENKDVDNTFVIDLNSDNNSLSDELTNETNSGLNDTKKSKKKVPILTFKHIKNVPKNVFIIGSIVFFVVGLFMGKVFFSKNYCSVPTKKMLENKLFVADGKNNITEVSGLKYKIPTSYIYDKSDGYLIVYDKDGAYKVSIKNVSGDYDTLALSKVSIKESIKEQGFIVNDIRELVVNNNNYIVVDITDNTLNHLIAFTGFLDSVFYVDIVTSSNEIDTSILNVSDDIIRNAEKIDKTNSLESIRGVDVTDISMKAALEYKKATGN